MEFPLLSSPSPTILLRGDTPTTVATTANLYRAVARITIEKLERPLTK
jgi:hypothetical protein